MKLQIFKQIIFFCRSSTHTVFIKNVESSTSLYIIYIYCTEKIKMPNIHRSDAASTLHALSLAALSDLGFGCLKIFGKGGGCSLFCLFLYITKSNVSA